MKRLILVRHGKAEALGIKGGDHSRPLAPKGKSGAKALGEFLASKKDWWPELCYVSDAKRALETHEILFNQLPGAKKAQHQIRSDLYQCSFHDLEALMWELPDSIESFMMVGHNPTFSDFVSYLLKNPVDLKTGEIIGLESDSRSWSGDRSQSIPSWQKAFSWRES